MTAPSEGIPVTATSEDIPVTKAEAARARPGWQWRTCGSC